MKRLAPLSFWLTLAVTMLLAGLCARQLSPGVAAQVRPQIFSFRDKFLGSYGPVSLSEYILAHNILGAASQVQSKDVLLLGSSKMMYGVDGGIARRLLASKGINVGIYNLAFGHGEGLVFPAWLIERLGIRKKLLIIDATDNTSQYHVEAQAQDAMNSSPLEAWKLIIETNIQFRLDWVLHGVLPRGRIDTRGIEFEPYYLRPAHWRDWKTGDVWTRPGPNARAAAPGTFPFDFDADRRLREKVFSVFRSRNLGCDFVSIPYTGHDPIWARRAAEIAGCQYVSIPSSDFYTVDGVHLNKQSRDAFTQLLVDAIAPEFSGLAEKGTGQKTQ